MKRKGYHNLRGPQQNFKVFHGLWSGISICTFCLITLRFPTHKKREFLTHCKTTKNNSVHESSSRVRSKGVVLLLRLALPSFRAVFYSPMRSRYETSRGFSGFLCQKTHSSMFRPIGRRHDHIINAYIE